MSVGGQALRQWVDEPEGEGCDRLESGTSRMVVRTDNAVDAVVFDGAAQPLDHDAPPALG